MFCEKCHAELLNREHGGKMKKSFFDYIKSIRCPEYPPKGGKPIGCGGTGIQFTDPYRKSFALFGSIPCKRCKGKGTIPYFQMEELQSLYLSNRPWQEPFRTVFAEKL